MATQRKITIYDADGSVGTTFVSGNIDPSDDSAGEAAMIRWLKKNRPGDKVKFYSWEYDRPANEDGR